MTRFSTTTVLVLAAALYSAALAIRSRPSIASDDAAITFRYAERLAEGKGLTYNDHERVLGTSSPLYAVALAVPAGFGARVERSAEWIGVISYAVCVGLVVLTAMRTAGLSAGVSAGILLTGDTYFRFQALSGLEVAFAAAVGMAAIVAFTADWMALAGFLCALSVATKLDGLAVAAALLIAATVGGRRVPWRFLMAGAATLVPALVIATVYYGSPIPQSLTTKLAGGEGQPFDPFWILHFLAGPTRRFAILLAVAGPFVCGHFETRASKTIAVLWAWAGLHVLGYSSIDLGAPYPWYQVMPVVPVAALAGTTIGWTAMRLSTARAGHWLTGSAALVAIVALAEALLQLPGAWTTRPLQSWEAVENDRRAVGVFLREHASRAEILQSAFGWPAFESRLPTNDRAGLNTRTEVEPVSYLVERGNRGAGTEPAGMIVLAKFDSARTAFRGADWYVLYGRSGSEAARWRRGE